jgi:HPt (histidine-containing phosphotransfer) domain-containing protein
MMLSNDSVRVIAEERLRGLTAHFVTRLPERLAAIEACLARRDTNVELLRHLHALAGTAGTFGIDDVAELAAEGEALAMTELDAERLSRLRVVVNALAHAIALRIPATLQEDHDDGR